MNIRNAKISDLENVFQLSKKMATSFIVEYEAFKNSFLININNQDAIILVAEADQLLIGYLLGFDHYAFYANGRVSLVEEVFVDENYRKNGTGRKLMHYFENWSKKRDGKLIGLATRRASEFYKAIGFDESAGFFIKKL